MNILIVDGNDRESSSDYHKIGMKTQYEVYENLLSNISPIPLNITIIHPTWSKYYLNNNINLDNFEGVVWTGSRLNIYNIQPSIQRQIDLAKILFEKKIKIFGSCWGLQVLVTAAGGKVRKNPVGLEAVIAKNIKLHKSGVDHPMYKGKPVSFDSFCWHYDEVEKLPDRTNILSYNSYSQIQSISFFREKSEIWAVQYHPEFNPKWMAGLMSMRKSILLEKDIYKSEKEFEKFYNFFSNYNNDIKLNYNDFISETLIEDKIRYLEISNWIEYLQLSS